MLLRNPSLSSEMHWHIESCSHFQRFGIPLQSKSWEGKWTLTMNTEQPRADIERTKVCRWMTGIDSVVKKFEVVLWGDTGGGGPIQRVIPRHTNRPLPQLSFPSKLTRWETNPEITGIISLCKIYFCLKKEWFRNFFDLNFFGTDDIWSIRKYHLS